MSPAAKATRMPPSSYAARASRALGRIGIGGAAVAVHVHHAGDPGAQQPRRAQQGIESRREAPAQRERDQPGLQQAVPDSLPDGRDAVVVVMGVDHARHDCNRSRRAVASRGTGNTRPRRDSHRRLAGIRLANDSRPQRPMPPDSQAQIEVAEVHGRRVQSHSGRRGFRPGVVFCRTNWSSFGFRKNLSLFLEAGLDASRVPAFGTACIVPCARMTEIPSTLKGRFILIGLRCGSYLVSSSLRRPARPTRPTPEPRSALTIC